MVKIRNCCTINLLILDQCVSRSDKATRLGLSLALVLYIFLYLCTSVCLTNQRVVASHSLHVCSDEEAKNELRRLIRQHLSEELKKLRVSVDEQIKASEEVITKRLQSADSSAPSSGKTKKK